MDVRDLRVFAAVVESGSVSAASSRLFLSQPAVSRTLQRVEGGMGAVLFHRARRPLMLTEAGVSLYQRCAALLESFDQVVAEVRAIADDHSRATEMSNSIRIGIFFPAAAELTAPILHAYRRACPGIGVTTVDISRLGGERALLAGAVDAALLWTPVNVRHLTVVSLFDDEVAAIMSSEDPLACRPAIDVSALAERRYTVTASMGTRWQTASQLRPWRHRPDRAVHVDTVHQALTAVATGRAVSIAPMSLSRYAPVAGIRYLPVKADGHPSAVACCRRSEIRPFVRRFLGIAELLAERHRNLVPGALPPGPPPWS